MADGNPAGLGHNQPPEPTALEAFQAHMEDLRTEAGNWLDGSPVENQAQADEVSRLMDAHRKATKDADAARAEEKKPHLEAGKAIDAKWKPLIDGANLTVDACKKTLAPWLMKLDAEKRATADAARAEAEAKAQAAAEAMRAAAPTDLAAREEAEALVDAARAAERAASKAEGDRAQSHGGSRATSLRSYYSPVLMDGVIAARHYWDRNREACEAFFLALAKTDVQNGARSIPGFDVIEEKRVV